MVDTNPACLSFDARPDWKMDGHVLLPSTQYDSLPLPTSMRRTFRVRRWIAWHWPSKPLGIFLFRVAPFLGQWLYVLTQFGLAATFAIALAVAFDARQLQELLGPVITGHLKSGGSPMVAVLLAANAGLFGVMQFISKGWADSETATAAAVNLDLNSAIAPSFREVRRIVDGGMTRGNLTQPQLDAAHAILREYTLNAEAFWQGRFSFIGFGRLSRHLMQADLSYFHFLTHEEHKNGKYSGKPEFVSLHKLARLWGACIPQHITPSELPRQSNLALPAPNTTAGFDGLGVSRPEVMPQPASSSGRS